MYEHTNMKQSTQCTLQCLETRVSSQDTYLHVSVLAQSRRIHVLPWLESRSSMSHLGSVS